MAKFELKFLDFWGGNFIKVEKKTKELHTRNKDIILISIEDELKNKHSICFDKSTAIKFSKALRTEINKIIESEVSDV